ncbi:hypothetical protein ACSAZK_10960 [Methanosarcina sp. Mfa9]|uniref:hypothetical protein n=1 Tax=Methanosarcina sp. Mfa9 TaxID=3439063 RepID=UPI003F8542BA
MLIRIKRLSKTFFYNIDFTVEFPENKLAPKMRGRKREREEKEKGGEEKEKRRRQKDRGRKG